MASSTTPIAGSLSREGSTAWPLLTEAILLVLAICALLPRFALLAAQETGRDGRFAEATITVRELPDPVLPKLCATFGSSAETLVRDRLCGQTDAIPGRRASIAFRLHLPTQASARDRHFSRHYAMRRRAADLRQQLREGQDDVLSASDAIAATEGEIQPFIKRYSIDAADEEGPLPLSCVNERVEAALAEPPARPGSDP